MHVLSARLQRWHQPVYRCSWICWKHFTPLPWTRLETHLLSWEYKQLLQRSLLSGIFVSSYTWAAHSFVRVLSCEKGCLIGELFFAWCCFLKPLCWGWSCPPLPSRLYSWVPLPAVGRVPLLCCEDRAVGLPRASLHGHRSSQWACPDGYILCDQVTNTSPKHLCSSERKCELKWDTNTNKIRQSWSVFLGWWVFDGWCSRPCR